MKHMMHKVIIIAIVAAVGIAGLMMMKGRFGNMQLFSSKVAEGADLTLLNDSTDTISVEYKEGGKNVAMTLPVNEKIGGGKGFIKIFTAKKSGTYDLTYPFPRSSGAIQEVALSQVIAAASKEATTDAVYTKKGMIGDIVVVYEEARDID
jgi:hypothetical protein